MKKLLATMALAAAVAAPAAMAATYKIDATNANVYFFIDHTTYYSWNLSGLTLNVNDTTKAAHLSGNIFRSGSTTAYALNVAFTNPYTSGTNLNWGDHNGTIRNTVTGNTSVIRDYQSGVGAMDARIGIDGAPYNASTSKIELGFWSYNVGTARHDFNVTLTCTSGTGAGGPSNANGTCTTGTGTGVPLPGTLALLGLAAVGLGVRRIKLA
jgi:hypothetical protein